jgi:hypothetical protein
MDRPLSVGVDDDGVDAEIVVVGQERLLAGVRGAAFDLVVCENAPLGSSWLTSVPTLAYGCFCATWTPAPVSAVSAALVPAVQTKGLGRPAADREAVDVGGSVNVELVQRLLGERSKFPSRSTTRNVVFDRAVISLLTAPVVARPVYMPCGHDTLIGAAPCDERLGQDV